MSRVIIQYIVDKIKITVYCLYSFFVLNFPNETMIGAHIVCHIFYLNMKYKFKKRIY